jgi:hypothetical protein
MESLNLSPNDNKQSEINYATVAQAKSGASWFYWIAGLSLVNSLIFLFGGNWSFFAGLGVTQVIDAIVDQISQNGDLSVIKIVAFGIDLIIAALFVGCGFFAHKFQIWAFIVGMILYLLDGILLLVLGAYFPAGFHIFALFMIFRGLSAAREINASQNLTTQ